MSRFTESEFGDLLQKAICMMENEQRRQKGEKIPNLINVVDAARVAVDLLQGYVHPPKPREPFVCPNGIDEHTEFPFTCSCGITAEMVRDALDRIDDEPERACLACGEPKKGGVIHLESFNSDHYDLRYHGHRVWGTVWHADRDI